MKPADPLGGLLPPAPPARDLPDRDRHRREVLAAVEAGRWPARPRASTVAWLAPLSAALAVLVILTGVFVLPGLFSGPRRAGTSTPSGHPAAGGGHQHGPWHRRTENSLVSTAVRILVIHGGVGSVSVTGGDRSTVSVSAHVAYRGRAPLMGRRVRHGVLELFYWCETGSTCHVAFDVAVPRSVNVIANYRVGQIRLTGLTATVDAYTGTGQIRASALSVRQAHLTTGTGLISAGFRVPPRLVLASTGLAR